MAEFTSRYLGVGSGSHAEQTGHVMIAFERLVSEVQPDLVIVVGDVNSTLACTLAAAKLGTTVAHVEAGLRSFDRTMFEEMNRIVTDHIADLLFTTKPSGRYVTRSGGRLFPGVSNNVGGEDCSCMT